MNLLIAALAVMAAPPDPHSPKAIAPETWVSNDDYPPEALRQGWEGMVGMEMKVDEAGKVTSCSIARSSGFPILDEDTCNLIVARALFQPGTDGDGHHIASTAKRNVRWQIPKDGPDTMVVISIGVNGPECTLQADPTKAILPSFCTSLTEAVVRSGAKLPVVVSAPVTLDEIQPDE